ncbi:DUF4421 family protein [Sediminicola luteus]|uniref:DUF4421 family protein n=1 Tax=Sediminicola luteus TaxID=319238 RepID=UPI0015578031|nr:DUF4421 family protein [Sediminicola luteus]
MFTKAFPTYFNRIIAFWLFAVVSLLLLPSASAQIRGPQKTDSTYIRRYEDPVVFKGSFDTNIKEYEITESGNTLNLATNENLRTAITFFYRGIGFTYGFAPSAIPVNNDDVLKGNTDLTTYRLNLNMVKVITNFEYTKTKGFYVTNTGDLLSDWQLGEDPYLLYPDLEITRFSSTAVYVNNYKKFSFKALTNQAEDQIKSAGSFIPSFQYIYTRWYNKDPEVVDDDPIRDFHDFIVRGGYQYTFVISKKWFASLGLGLGGGAKMIYDKERSGNTLKKKTVPMLSTTSDLHLGFSGNHWFGGMRLSANTNNYQDRQEDVKIEDGNTYFLFFVGYRFTAPKKVTQAVDKFMDKVLPIKQ